MALLSDLALARRLERTEASANAHFVEARARAVPESGAQWIEVAGAYAMFDGLFQQALLRYLAGVEAALPDLRRDALHLLRYVVGSPVLTPQSAPHSTQAQPERREPSAP